MLSITVRLHLGTLLGLLTLLLILPANASGQSISPNSFERRAGGLFLHSVPQTLPGEALQAVNETGVLAGRIERSTRRDCGMWGLVAGVAAGAAAGYFIMATTEDWLAPPAYYVTVPVGGVLGWLIGSGIGSIRSR